MRSYYSEIPSELKRDVKREIADFKLPEDWRDGRVFLRGIAIDDANTIDVDDAIHTRPTSKGGQLVTVSVADVGTFMPQFPALETIARSRIKRLITDEGKFMPIWPDKVVRQTLSLTKKQHRPVLAMRIPVSADGSIGDVSFTRGMLRVVRHTNESAQQILQLPAEDTGSRATMLRGLAKVARSWRESSQGISCTGPQSSKEVLNSIIALSAHKAAEYAMSHTIPGVYRVGFNKASHILHFAGEPDVNAPNLRITSPLRRFIDYLNQANIIAHLIEKPYPFAEDEIQTFLQEYAHSKSQRVSDPVRMHELLERVENDDMSACVKAFFHPSLSSQGTQLRRIARDKIIDQPQMIRSFINMLVAKGVLKRIADSVQPDGKLTGATYLVDTAGNTYTDIAPGRRPSSKRRAKQQKDDVETIVGVAALLEQQLLSTHPNA